MKKLFGGIDLTWKKLLIFAVLIAIYTAIMAMVPALINTSFNDIAVFLEWWLLFGIIIIMNSKSPLDSALKCFVFFLVSQPLIYLIQVPFSSVGWSIFGYYKYWFMWTLATFPMGYIGYYIQKRNWFSVLILLPAICAFAYFGLMYLSSAFEHFPNHLLSSIFCFAMVPFVTCGIFDNWKHRMTIIGIALLLMLGVILFHYNEKPFEKELLLDTYDITFVGEPYISYFTRTKSGNAELVSKEDHQYAVKLNGYYGGNYKFGIQDDSGIEYRFEYYFDKKTNSIIVNYLGAEEE